MGLDAAATEEDEAVALAVAEAMCAEFNHTGDEEDDDDFADFMRQRVAELPRPPRRGPVREPGRHGEVDVA